jgi:hypothetical protein
MKIRRLLSAVAASAVIASAVAVSASAELAVNTPTTFALTSGTGMWMMKLYVPSEGIDSGIDVTNIGSVVFTIKADEPEYFEGQTGGAVVVSCGPTSVTPEDHKWASKSYWGVVDTDLDIDTHDEGSDLQTVKVGDYTYQLTCPLDDSNCVYSEVTGSEDGYVQIALQEWGSDMSVISVVSFEVLDTNGNTMVAYDGDGNEISGGTTAAAADDTAADDTAAEDTAAADDTAATTTTTSADKGSPDTGVEGIAAVAGVAVVAAGAVVLSKKRK